MERILRIFRKKAARNSHCGLVQRNQQQGECNLLRSLTSAAGADRYGPRCLLGEGLAVQLLMSLEMVLALPTPNAIRVLSNCGLLALVFLSKVCGADTEMGLFF